MGAVIDPSLLQSLETKPKTTIIISFKVGTGTVLKDLESREFETREARATAVHDTLKAHMESSQKPVTEFLQSKVAEKTDEQLTFESMWINNSIVVKNADLSLVQQLAQLEGIEKIKENAVVAHIHPS